MKTKNANVEVIATAKETTKKQSSKNKNLDTATIKTVINKDKERATTVKEKNFLYKFQVEQRKIKLTAKEEKKNRNKIRRNLTLLTNQIIIDNLKKKDLSKCKDFINFYKENYILNDFTLKSLTNVNDEDKIKDYNFVLDLCKESLKK